VSFEATKVTSSEMNTRAFNKDDMVRDKIVEALELL
jgi:hypothetical protein